MSDILYAAVASVVAFVVAVALYVYAFTLTDEVTTAQLLWVTGFAYLALFIVMNFALERRWFPRPRAGAVVQPLVGPARRAHMAMGTVEAVIFIIAIVLIGSGTSIMGTRGYGSF